jgi:hypothetical protein
MESENSEVKIALYNIDELKKSMEPIKKCIEFTITNNNLTFDEQLNIFLNYKMVISSFESLEVLQKFATTKK